MIEEYLNDPDTINEYAWDTLENGGNTDYALEMGLKGKKIAEEEQWDDYGKAALCDTVALAYFKKGDKANAALLQTKAIEYLKRAPEYGKEGQDFSKRLKQYQK